MKSIINKNSKGQKHGYQEWYPNTSNKITYRANYKNSRVIGYSELHYMYQTLYTI